MKPSDFLNFICPESKSDLTLDITEQYGHEVSSGSLRSRDGQVYPISMGLPDLTYPKTLATDDSNVRKFYDGRSEDYDKYLHITFRTHGEDERVTRNRFIDLLELVPTSRVLEVACGTGRDSELISNRLGPTGHLTLQDISNGMLTRCKEKMRNCPTKLTYCLSNASHLPFRDRSFDAVYSFGGLGEFSDVKRCLKEMVRVCRVGGKVVVGDESIPPWLRHTEFAKILATTNKQFLAPVPMAELPVDAREMCLRYVIGGVFYLIDFRVGDGEPKGDFDTEIPGVRGGTLRTRYEGQLEGVTPETKRLAHDARARAGVSMHRWLDDVVRTAAKKQLSSDESVGDSQDVKT
jgi:ubiquinone/menaquinone biosynthesis C-methylase UbiE